MSRLDMNGVDSSANGYSAALLGGMQRTAQKMSDMAEQVMLGMSPEAAVEMKLLKAELTAQAKMVRSIDKAVGTLIDDLA